MHHRIGLLARIIYVIIILCYVKYIIHISIIRIVFHRQWSYTELLCVTWWGDLLKMNHLQDILLKQLLSKNTIKIKLKSWRMFMDSEAFKWSPHMYEPTTLLSEYITTNSGNKEIIFIDSYELEMKIVSSFLIRFWNLSNSFAPWLSSARSK